MRLSLKPTNGEVGGGGWDHWAVQFLKGLCPHALRQHPGPTALVKQVCLGWTTGAGWGPWPAFSCLHLGPGRELGAAQGQGGVRAHSEYTLGRIPRQVGCAILSAPPAWGPLWEKFSNFS